MKQKPAGHTSTERTIRDIKRKTRKQYSGRQQILWYRQVNYFTHPYPAARLLNNRPPPFIERTDPEIAIMFSADQVPSKVE